MREFFKKFGLIAVGTLTGFALALHFSAEADRPQASSLPVEELRTLSEVFGRIKSDYVEPVDDRKLIKEAITGMVSGLDPHSAYLDQDAYRELQQSTQGEFGGLGIEVGMEDGVVKVISPIDDTPAARAGIKAGDLIVKLDDTAVRGMTLMDAVKRMRGKPGTDITLTVVRKNEHKPLVLTLTRAVIKTKSVTMKALEPGYASIRISQFQERTAEDLAAAVQKVYDDNKGAVKGLVLDLRNDPGGLLNAAVGVGAVFLKSDDLVVYTEGRIAESRMRLTTSPDNYLRTGESDFVAKLPAAIKTVPLVVLVNSGSASASEIVAGALQDHHRAKILGLRTFGKGSVQTILPLTNDTALKLTTARYFTPNGRSIQAKGIEPDEVIGDSADAVVDEGEGIREADLDKHLSNPAGGEAKQPAVAHDKKPKPETKKPAAAEEKKGEDYQMQQALLRLKGIPAAKKP
jgi:carboxyl-terminal processing protease